MKEILFTMLVPPLLIMLYILAVITPFALLGLGAWLLLGKPMIGQ